ncbi:heavy-metal-associated domain-containing protein [Candidatus Thioglobus sp.]|jgi:copper chaperone CopZ|uniref:heavy-metal-associated domain-containing protein n=1 Tax=Candidatus Thioglobus sp. TaxID=2026721 RepID=UPI001E0AE940|nr:heavy-metal-associated domain-containing protein [Candidatus Thioglobus sp.]MBT3277456.1 heavy-metal-associated domain-containing protein [Candidatus Thioglobus sp.]MBT3447530.1 heavy-metal-associated domain-containing protein [Candidatus Thioglobus sp.]MBT3745412.1 heavy-metal-associated domain-containing protein [Candidatus Thioglobus sp.]MBT4000936.1 heavy-metal-associated domain-containing protein [Candidatus Thioglobus sp.]MBT4181541.1 heavy-metal-associated domain-containing protein [
MEITVDNIKCGGCAGSITKKLTATFGTDKINVNIEKGIININLDNSKKDELSKVLLDLGYPEIDSVHGFDSAKAKAKSFVSCAIGKMDQ